MAGGNHYSSGASSSTSRGIVGLTTNCTCGIEVVVLTIKNGPNSRRRFFGCPKWPCLGNIIKGDCALQSSSLWQYLATVVPHRYRQSPLYFGTSTKVIVLRHLQGGKHYSSGASSSTSRGIVGSRTNCTCGLEAVVCTVKNGPNSRRSFFGNPKWPETTSFFLKWVNCNSNVDDDLWFQIIERDTTIVEMEFNQSVLEEKANKFQGKKNKLEDDLQEMKTQIC
uniref:Zinc finger GRF-type domain-containing protein n=1 Tax=Chenopodium quinoa TaxID=63459 RepID=A0A803N9D1_CHEQI